MCLKKKAEMLRSNVEKLSTFRRFKIQHMWLLQNAEQVVTWIAKLEFGLGFNNKEMHSLLAHKHSVVIVLVLCKDCT